MQTALGAPGLVCDRTPGMIAAAAYAARGMELPFSMGLRPRLSADAAFAAYWNPGLAPGGLSFKILSPGSVVIQGRAAKPRLAWLTRGNVSYRLPYRAA